MEKVPVFTKYYDIVNWILDKVEKFPRSQRFIFGHRLANLAVDILEDLIRAYYSKNKVSILKEVNIRLEIFRILLRMVKDRKLVSLRQYEYISKEIPPNIKDAAIFKVSCAFIFPRIELKWNIIFHMIIRDVIWFAVHAGRL